jgi:hypothetical protein
MFSVYLYVDGKFVAGRSFTAETPGPTTIKAKRISSTLEQPYVIISLNGLQYVVLKDRVYSGSADRSN